jgi:membrane associated rhomboid family serine protease
MEFRPSRFSILPPVVKYLLIINIVMFAATWFLEQQGISLVDILGLHYFSADKFKPYQLITYMFMHGNLQHIFFNMFAVWMFGNALENVWGSKRFLTYYLITGIGAALIQYLVFAIQLTPIIDNMNFVAYNPTPANVNSYFATVPVDASPEALGIQREYLLFDVQHKQLLAENNPRAAGQLAHDFFIEYRDFFLDLPVIVGASGALFGLLLAFGMIFPNALIFLFFAVPIRAKYFVVLYGIIELWSGISNAQGDNVAHFAHLGGMLFGWILIKSWKRKGL